MRRTELGVGAPVHSSAVFTYKEGAHRHPPRDVKRLTHGHRASGGTSESRGQAPGPLPSVFPRDQGPGCAVCGGNAASALTLLITLQSVWREQSDFMTLGFWTAGVKPFKSGQAAISEGDVEDPFFPLGFKEGKHDLIH